jgi:hypothetical protein
MLSENQMFLISLVYYKDGKRLEKPMLGIFEIREKSEITCECGRSWTIGDELEHHLHQVNTFSRGTMQENCLKCSLRFNSDDIRHGFCPKCLADVVASSFEG